MLDPLGDGPRATEEELCAGDTPPLRCDGDALRHVGVAAAAVVVGTTDELPTLRPRAGSRWAAPSRAGEGEPRPAAEGGDTPLFFMMGIPDPPFGDNPRGRDEATGMPVGEVRGEGKTRRGMPLLSAPASGEEGSGL